MYNYIPYIMSGFLFILLITVIEFQFTFQNVRYISNPGITFSYCFQCLSDIESPGECNSL